MVNDFVKLLRLPRAIVISIFSTKQNIAVILYLPDQHMVIYTKS